MVSIKYCSLIDTYVDPDNGSDNSKTHQLLWFYKDIVFIPLLLIYVILESEKTVVSKWTRPQTNRNTFFFFLIFWLTLGIYLFPDIFALRIIRICARVRPSGMGWRGRWEGVAGWGTYVNPWLIHVNVWQKPLKCCKVFSRQLTKVNGKKKKKYKHI